MQSLVAIHQIIFSKNENEITYLQSALYYFTDWIYIVNI